MSVTRPSAAFSSLDARAQAAVREQQRQRKQVRKERKLAAQARATTNTLHGESLEGSEYPDRISRDEYFDAVPSGLYVLPALRAKPEHLTRILSLVNEVEDLAQYCYFVFSPCKPEAWDPAFNARLLWEGFFTITADLVHGMEPQPLPELQPFYGVVHWHFFESSCSVRKNLRRVRASLGVSECKACKSVTAATSQAGATISTTDLRARPNVVTKESEEAAAREAASPERGATEAVFGGEAEQFSHLRIVVSSDVEASWRQLDTYQCERHSKNWMTLRYLRMLQAASRDESINLTLHAIELRRRKNRVPPARREEGTADTPPTDGSKANLEEEVVAGEIGFSVGHVYTSLSGWTSRRTSEALGSAQLVLLGRWLQARGYAFWSLGHCYSPEMEYKRALGLRIYPRQAFLRLLARHRGPARSSPSTIAGDGCEKRQNVKDDGAAKKYANPTLPTFDDSFGAGTRNDAACMEQTGWGKSASTFRPFREGDGCDAAVLVAEVMPRAEEYCSSAVNE